MYFREGGSPSDPRGARLVINYAPANLAPLADADGPYTATVAGGVTLDGSGSTDDHGIVSYLWDLDGDLDWSDGITGVGPTLTYAEVGLAAGDYEIALKVTDAGGLWDVDTAQLHVDPIPEPATLLLVGTGLIGAIGIIRRRRMI
jgi:hypothetical protein